MSDIPIILFAGLAESYHAIRLFLLCVSLTDRADGHPCIVAVTHLPWRVVVSEKSTGVALFTRWSDTGVSPELDWV